MIKTTTEKDDLRRRRTLVGACTTLGGIAILGASAPFLISMMPSEKTKNEPHHASVFVDISKLEVNQGILTEWRALPYIVLRRSSEQLRSLREIEHLLADPTSMKSVQPDAARNQHRSIDPEYLVASMVCTHLGCLVINDPKYVLPNRGADFWKGGFDCPCHTSYFDLAGRVYKNMPAPTNLEVPPYRFVNSKTIEIGLSA